MFGTHREQDNDVTVWGQSKVVSQLALAVATAGSLCHHTLKCRNSLATPLETILAIAVAATSYTALAQATALSTILKTCAVSTEIQDGGQSLSQSPKQEPKPKPLLPKSPTAARMSKLYQQHTFFQQEQIISKQFPRFQKKKQRSED